MNSIISVEMNLKQKKKMKKKEGKKEERKEERKEGRGIKTHQVDWVLLFRMFISLKSPY